MKYDQVTKQPQAKGHLGADILDCSQDVLVGDEGPPGGAAVGRLDQGGELVEQSSRCKVVETDHILHLGDWVYVH